LIGTRAADQQVVAGIALERVGAAIAGQNVCEGGAGEVLDPAQRIALRVAARCLAGRQVDRNARGRARVARGVDA
jgi:hypothetical protein